jgi:hypothetical protein
MNNKLKYFIILEEDIQYYINEIYQNNSVKNIVIPAQDLYLAAAQIKQMEFELNFKSQYNLSAFPFKAIEISKKVIVLYIPFIFLR